MIVYGAMVTTNQVMLTDLKVIMLRSMALMILLGALTDFRILTLTTTMFTIGMIKEMLTSATLVVVMDAACVEDMDMGTEMRSLEIMDTT